MLCLHAIDMHVHFICASFVVPLLSHDAPGGASRECVGTGPAEGRNSRQEFPRAAVHRRRRADSTEKMQNMPSYLKGTGFVCKYLSISKSCNMFRFLFLKSVQESSWTFIWTGPTLFLAMQTPKRKKNHQSGATCQMMAAI